MTNESNTPKRRPYGTVRTALRQVISEQRGETFTVADVAHAVDGLTKQRTGIALAAMVRSGELRRIAPGTYARAVEAAEPTNDATPKTAAAATLASGGPEAHVADRGRPNVLSVAGQIGQHLILRDDTGRLWAAKPANLADL